MEDEVYGEHTTVAPLNLLEQTRHSTYIFTSFEAAYVRIPQNIFSGRMRIDVSVEMTAHKRMKY